MKYDLFPYGIQTENSTHRIHVDIQNRCALVYKTACALEIMPEPIYVSGDEEWVCNGYYIIRPPWANGRETARGIRMPFYEIPGCSSVSIPPELLIKGDETTTTGKGKYAVSIVVSMLSQGLIPIQFDITEINDKAEQISGLDLKADQLLLQVKYDFDSKKRGLFLQTHERNINKDY